MNAIVLFAHGEGALLTYGSAEGDDPKVEAPIMQYIQALPRGLSLADGSDSTYGLAEVEHEPHADGVYFGILILVDNGAGDLHGIRECCLSLKKTRLVTAEEWDFFRKGEWPWEPMLDEEEPEPVVVPEDAVRVQDLGEGFGPYKLYIGDYGVAQWPSESADESPRQYAEEVARCVRVALAALK